MSIDKALLRNVQREFRTLEKAKQSPSTYDILDIAGALRHLLVNGLFKRAWDELRRYELKHNVESKMPRQPVISAVVLDTLIDLPYVQGGKSIVIAADATTEDGVTSTYIMFRPGIVPDDELEDAAREQLDLSKKMHMKLDVYKGSCCMILKNWLVRRDTVIKYVANKLGARHYDTQRKTKPGVITEDNVFEILDKSFDFFGDNPSPSNLPIYYGASGNALHAVILGICTDLEESRDVQWFLHTLNHFLGESPTLGFR